MATARAVAKLNVSFVPVAVTESSPVHVAAPATSAALTTALLPEIANVSIPVVSGRKDGLPI